MAESLSTASVQAEESAGNASQISWCMVFHMRGN